MYSLNKDTDTSSLIEKSLIQVAIGLHQIILNFDGDLSISSEGKIVHKSDGHIITISSYPHQCISLMRLIGMKIQKVLIKNEKTLILQFNNNEELEFQDDSEHYETLSVTGKDNNIVM